MNISYQLTNSDFLEYQLYASSKSELQKKRRFRSRIMIPIFYLVLGIFFANHSETFGFGISFLVFGMSWFAFYPWYSKGRYINYFKKHVEEKYKNLINKTVEIDFDKNSVIAKDFTSESRINGTELKELIETKDHFFIILTTELSLIVPKHSIEDPSEFIKRVSEYGANYVDERNWKWR